jgi:uncharacterized membrane protein (UPF0127 family)
MKKFKPLKALAYLIVIALVIAGFYKLNVSNDESLPTLSSLNSSTVSTEENTIASDTSNINSLDSYETISIQAPKGTVLAYIADTEDKKEMGLGKLSSIPENKGMLFNFDEPASYGFWMKDMIFPLTIVWLDKNKKVVSLNENVSVDSFPALFYPKSNAMYVLEITAGAEKNFGIATNTVLSF